MKTKQLFLFYIGFCAIMNLCSAVFAQPMDKPEKEPVEFVNPTIGNISHLLMPTYPTVQLPNSMMRIFPVRFDYTTDRLGGLPLIVTHHRSQSALNFWPHQGDESGISNEAKLSYDQEKVKPYRYQVYLDELNIGVDFIPAHQSAIYKLTFDNSQATDLVFNCQEGELMIEQNTLSGYKVLGNKTKLYIYAEMDVKPEKVGALQEKGVNWGLSSDKVVVLHYPKGMQALHMRYGISYISEEQAKKNLNREISGYDMEALAKEGRRVWNEALGNIQVQGADEQQKAIFYSSLYRTFERPINISEDGRYFSAFDGQVHADEGKSFYTDDWIWDTYRATHPLRVLITPNMETQIIQSYIRMGEQRTPHWLPTFPTVSGDAHAMNSNHGIATIIDAYNKGLRDFDLEKAYAVSKAALEEKSLIPWKAVPAGVLDAFYKKNGYFPALKPGQKETVAEVHSWEKRQPVAVTLGTAYDSWCLSLMARTLGKTSEADHFLRASYNYRNIFNSETKFFHPKDEDGNFIPDIDYRISGGQGAREYYDENNGYVYRWDVQHNIGDLVSLIGGKKAFINGLEQMFNEPYGMARWDFYATLQDHTGNVGMFSMANEPSFHIPYLYNYAGEPWRTQKRIRSLLNQWFRNDLMGMPGDEDGGGMTAFVVFSQMGFYPVTPGSPTYNIGSPVFNEVKMDLGNGHYFEIKAHHASSENKYIQSAKLNGRELNQAWFKHADIKDGGLLEFEMGPVANKTWGKGTPPPSADPIP